MPTILWFGNLRVVIYPHDHLPEHVHVIGPDCEAVFELHCPGGPGDITRGLWIQDSPAATPDRRIDRGAGRAVQRLGGDS